MKRDVKHPLTQQSAYLAIFLASPLHNTRKHIFGSFSTLVLDPWHGMEKTCVRNYTFVTNSIFLELAIASHTFLLLMGFFLQNTAAHRRGVP